MKTAPSWPTQHRWNFVPHPHKPNQFFIRDGARDWLAVLKLNGEMTPIEQERITRVMTAAPNMLKALRAAECAVEELCIGQDPANQCWLTLAEVRAAIAKAEGQ